MTLYAAKVQKVAAKANAVRRAPIFDYNFGVMFGAFKASLPLSGGLLWKTPWRMSRPRKARLRKRLRAVDTVVDVIENALSKQKLTAKALLRWRDEMPREEEMLPRDKYTLFDKKEKKFRKSVHKLPKWTRVSQRLNPPGY